MTNNTRIYFDNNSTTIMDELVIQYIQELLQQRKPMNASSIHEDGRRARIILEKARESVANALSIDLHRDDYQVIFTSSGTEANNLVINNFQHIPILIAATEHVSLLDIEHSEKNIIPVNNSGIISEEVLLKMLKSFSGKKLVSVMLANNETGVIQNIQSLIEITHQNGDLLHCDASQALTKIEVNLKDLNCDLLTISSHKCGGPVGVGALIAKKSLNLSSMIKGGKQELGLRAGTENVLAIAGFGKALDNISQKIERFKQIELLRDRIEAKLKSVSKEVQVMGQDVARLPNTSCIRMPNVKSQEQLIKFDLAGISISAGSACSSGRIAGSHVLKAMNVDENIIDEFVRVSLGIDNTQAEVDQFINVWNEIYNRGNI